MNKNIIKEAWIKTLPVMAGYIVLGMGFGILLVSKGYSVWLAAAMSIFIYAGSMQYVAIDMLTGGATLISAALMTVMVNARHLFYGISMIDKYKDTGVKKPYLIFALTDETYSLVCNYEMEDDSKRKDFYFFASFFDQMYWVVGSLAGALLGQVIPFSTKGIEFSMTALFVVVFVEQWLSSKDHLPAIIGLVCSLVCLFIFGNNFIIPSMIAITIMVTLLRKRMEKGV